MSAGLIILLSFFILQYQWPTQILLLHLFSSPILWLYLAPVPHISAIADTYANAIYFNTLTIVLLLVDEARTETQLLYRLKLNLSVAQLTTKHYSLLSNLAK